MMDGDETSIMQGEENYIWYIDCNLIGGCLKSNVATKLLFMAGSNKI